MSELENTQAPQNTQAPDTVTFDQRARSHLVVENLVKRYGRKLAVNSVSFAIQTGEITGLLGPNGAGKTTLFYSIVGFIRPTAGAIILNGENITQMPMYKRAQLGLAYLPQEPSIFRKLTVEQNIMSILETRIELTKVMRQKRLEELLDEFRIQRIRKQAADTLSGGERRRTEIARALASDPKFLLLDEPFAGIDPIAVGEIKGIIKQLAQAGIGILITDHNVRDTLEITNMAYIIHMGSILVSGDSATILAHESAQKIYLGENFRM